MNQEIQAEPALIRIPVDGGAGCPECPPAQPFQPAPSSTPPKDIVLTKEERLEVENLSLRTRLLAKEGEDLNRELDRQLAEARVAITMLQRQLQAKYGIDFTKQQIEYGTGRIIPAPSSR